MFEIITMEIYHLLIWITVTGQYKRLQQCASSLFKSKTRKERGTCRGKEEVEKQLSLLLLQYKQGAENAKYKLRLH